MVRWIVVFGLLGCGGAGVEETSPGAGESVVGDEVAADSGDPALAPRLKAILAAHDEARAEHCAPPLAWSSELEEAAGEWADTIVARGCELVHSDVTYGENLFMATADARTPAEVVDAWVSERESYDFRRGGFSMQTGHFTQVAWAGTQRLGCATRLCNGMDLWVCNYDPPGNVQGGYADNVQPTSCR